MDIIQTVKNYVLSVNKEYADTAPDHYDFWEQHIQFVVKESLLEYTQISKAPMRKIQ